MNYRAADPRLKDGPMKRQFAVLATASLLVSAALVTAKPATAGSYVSYSFGFSNYGYGYKYSHHGYRYGHHYGFPYHYRYGRHYGYPFRYYYDHHSHHGVHFSYHGSTYAKPSVQPAPAKQITVVRAVGTADPTLTYGYGNLARIDCKPTTGTSTVNGRRATFGGTFCYDVNRRGYIVPGSQHFIGYAN